MKGVWPGVGLLMKYALTMDGCVINMILFLDIFQIWLPWHLSHYYVYVTKSNKTYLIIVLQFGFYGGTIRAVIDNA